MKKSIFLITCCMVLSATNALAQFGTISTVAGTGTAGYSGDGGAATAAMISHPIFVTIDRSGNILFADKNNSRIRQISTSGSITTVVGTGVPGFSGDGGPATAAQINLAYGVALDTAGNMYIADVFNQRIRKVSTAGIITTVAGNGVRSFSGDGGPATLAMLWNPTNARVDPAGNIFIADNGNHRIRKVNAATGLITTVAGSGIQGYSGDGGQATAAKLNFPGSIWIDNVGNLIISDAINNVIRKVTPAGIISTIAGTGTLGYSGDGGPATAAMINQPTEVIADNAGNIYISDLNSRLRMVSASGIITTFAGNGTAGYTGDGGPATAAEINGPGGLFFSSTGSLYFADANNDVIRKLAPVTTQVESPSIASVKLFPNPAHNTLYVTSAEKLDALSIINISGHVVYQRDFKSKTANIDVSDLVQGLYLLSINNAVVSTFVKE